MVVEFIRAASPCVCHASVRSNGSHVTVSVADGCRTIGVDVTCDFDEQSGDIIVASSCREPVIRPSVGRCSRRCCTPRAIRPRLHTYTLSKPCNRNTKEPYYTDYVLCYNGMLPSGYVTFMLMSSWYSAAACEV